MENYSYSGLSRRTLFFGALGAAALYSLLGVEVEAEAKVKPPQYKHSQNKHHHRNYAIIPVPSVSYQHLVPEAAALEINLLDSSTRQGRIERTLRWKPITDAAELRYGVPSSLLMSMICVESEGDPTQPNASGDGGVGLIHMQPLMASLYGLRLITPSTKLVDHQQGRKIDDLVEKTDGDLEELIKHDDRFHPIKNIDAAARMMCDLFERSHTWPRALEMFSGRRTYDSTVLAYQQMINSKSHRKKLSKEFDARNKGKKLRGRTLTFNRYLDYFHALNRNFGLEQYKRESRERVI